MNAKAVSALRDKHGLRRVYGTETPVVKLTSQPTNDATEVRHYGIIGGKYYNGLQLAPKPAAAIPAQV